MSARHGEILLSSSSIRSAHADLDVLQARPRDIWKYMQTQPASFWLINFYLFIEYVRPQQVWGAIDFLPWAQLAIILSLVAIFVEGKIPGLGTILGPLVVAFSGVIVASSVVAISPAVAYMGWSLYFSWILIFILITNIITTEARFFVFILGFMLYSYKMSQHGFRTWMGNGFAFSGWGASGAPGWFQNSGEFGIQMCVFLPISVEFILALRPLWGRWKRIFFYTFPVSAVASMVASSSRGALIGGAAVGLWWVARSKHRVRSLIIVAVVGVLTWYVTPEQQKTRFASSGEDETSVSRLDRWKLGLAVAEDYPVLGIGYNNWYSELGPLSHNVFIQAVTELGYTGLAAFLALIAGTFIVNAQTRRLVKGVNTPTPFLRHMAFGLDGALIGFLTSGFFITVLYYPFFWINLAMTVSLHLAARHAVAQSTGAPRVIEHGPGGGENRSRSVIPQGGMRYR